MVKAFQIGKKYKLNSPYYSDEWLCEALLSTGYAAMTSGKKQSIIARKPQDWEIVLPKPRTGKGIIASFPAGDVRYWPDETAEKARKTFTEHVKIVEIEWTEVIADDKDICG